MCEMVNGVAHVGRPLALATFYPSRYQFYVLLLHSKCRALTHSGMSVQVHACQLMARDTSKNKILFITLNHIRRRRRRRTTGQQCI